MTGNSPERAEVREVFLNVSGMCDTVHLSAEYESAGHHRRTVEARRGGFYLVAARPTPP